MIKSTKLKYTGDISVSFSKKRKKLRYHNEGTPQLFMLFASVLCGQTSAFANRPTVVDITNADGDTSYLRKKLEATWTLVNEQTDSGNQWKAQLRCVLPYNLIASSEQEEETIKIKLINTNQEEFASADISSAVVNIQAGEQAIIEWKLYVSNEQSEN